MQQNLATNNHSFAYRLRLLKSPVLETKEKADGARILITSFLNSGLLFFFSFCVANTFFNQPLIPSTASKSVEYKSYKV